MSGWICKFVAIKRKEDSTMSNIQKYIAAFFIGAAIIVIGGFFLSVEKNGIFASFIMIGGLLMIIGRYLFQMKNVEINIKRHTEIIAGVSDIKKTIVVLENQLKSGSKKIDFNQFHEFEIIVNREKELVDLISYLPSEDIEKRKKYEFELNVLREDTANFPAKLIAIANEINELRKVLPSKIKKVEEELFNGYFGRAKDLLFEIQQERGDREIANNLGISYEEFAELDYEVEDGHTSKDGMTYYHIMKFSLNSPKEIIDKIRGVTKGNEAYELEVQPWFFDDKDDFE